MTTIAFDYESKKVSYDSRVTQDDKIITDSCVKMYKRDGLVLFAAGEMGQCDAIIDAYILGVSDAVNSFEAIIIDHGKAYKFAKYDKDSFEKYELKFSHAIGSGEEHAITAMDLGCSAKKAVKYAMKRDSCTGGRIRTFSLKG